MVIRLLLLCLCLVLPVEGVNASDAGTSALPWLKIDDAAKPAAMGGAYAAISDDAQGLSYNPAGAAYALRKNISFTHNQWITGTNLEHVSYLHKFTDSAWALGFNVKYFFSDSEDILDEFGSLTGGRFRETDFLGALTVSKRITDYLSLGVTGKYLRQELDSNSAQAFAADAGIMFRYDFISLGAAVTNAGTQVKLYKEEFPLPLNMSVSAAYITDFITVAVQGEKANDDDDFRFMAGAQIRFFSLITEDDVFALRAGYYSNSSDDAGPGVTMGLGFIYKDFSLDYAFVPLGDLGSANRVTFGIMFGPADTRAQSVKKTKQNNGSPSGIYDYQKYLQKEYVIK